MGEKVKIPQIIRIITTNIIQSMVLNHLDVTSVSWRLLRENYTGFEYTAV